MVIRHIERRLDRNYTRMLCAVLSKSSKQHPQNSSCNTNYLTSQKPFKQDDQDMQDTAGEANDLISDVVL